MINTTVNYKLEINKPSRSFECKVTIGNNIYTNEDIVDIILDYPQPQDGFSIGNTVSQSLDLTLINKGDIIYSASQVKVEIGLKVGSTIEYILMGIFNIDDVEKTDYTTKLTCYDNMIKFETPYFSNLGEKPTLQQVVNELAAKTGVQFIGSVPAYTVKKLNGFTCREILSYVASICAGNAVITRDGKFTIKTVKEVTKTIDGNNYFDFKREEVKYKVGKISCQIDENNIISKGALGTDSMELEFENPWITETILTEVYNKLNGLSYLGYFMKWQGDLSLDPYDIITVTDVKNVTRKIPVLAQKLTYTGGLTSEIEAKGESKNKNSFSSNGSTTNKVNRFVTEQAIIKEALMDKANIKDLNATNAKIQNLVAEDAKINNALINKAEIKDLNATNANIQKLIAEDAKINNALINKADINQLNAVQGNITSLNSDVANIKTLVNGNLSSNNIQAGGITSDRLTIANGFIKNVMIDNLDVSKINAGDISTNKFRIVSNSGKMLIADNTIQIRDNNRARVQIGKDASNDYNMYVWDKSGKLMFDATGLKADGIKNKIIRDDMISDNANIGGSKINIGSLVTEINKDTNTSIIKSSKVQIDTVGQTLDVAFNSLKSNVDNMEIGGRNLVKDSDTLQNLLGFTGGFAGVRTFIDDDEALCKKQIQVKCTTATPGGGVHFPVFPKDTNKIGKTYTWSFWAKCSSNKTLRVGHESGGVISIDLTTSWQKFTHTWKFTDYQYSSFLFYGTYAVNDILYIRDFKIEEGTKATSWTPALEDINNAISSVKKVTESNSTTIGVMQGQISTAINNTQIVKDGKTTLLKDDYNRTVAKVDSINSTIGSHTTKINNLTGNISSVDTKVNSVQRDLEGTKSTVSSHTTQINGLNSTVSTQGSSINQLKDKIALKVEASDINNAKKELQSSIDNNKNNIATAKTDITNIKNNVAAIEVNVTGITQRVSSTETTVKSHTTQLSTVDNKIDTAKNSAVNTSKSYADTKKSEAISAASTDAANKVNAAKNELNTAINKKANSADVYTKSEVYTKAQADSAIKVAKDNIELGVKNTYETKTNVESKITSAVNNVQIGGRNLAQLTSNTYSAAYSSFDGGTNRCPTLAKILTDGLKVGDTVTVRLIYKYTNIVAANGQTAKCWIQGSGNTTGWSAGSFAGSGSKTINGSGELEFLYNFKVNADHLKNTHWDTSVRHDYVQSGSVQWKALKVEKGTKATDWTPAPEDIDSAINKKANSADVYKKTEVYTKSEADSAIKVAKDAINLSVSSTYETKTNVTSKISTAKSEAISAASTDATSKVNSAKSELNTAINKKANSTDVYTKAQTDSQIKIAKDAITNTVSSSYLSKTDATNTYATKSSLTQTTDSIEAKFTSSGGYNLWRNSGFKNDIAYWSIHQHNSPTASYGFIDSTADWGFPDKSVRTCQIRYSNQTNKEYGLSQSVETTIGKKYTISFYYSAHRLNYANIIVRTPSGAWLANKYFNPQIYTGGKGSVSNWGKISLTFTASATSHTINIVAVNGQNDGYFWIAMPQVTEGEVALPYSQHSQEIYSGSTVIDASGVTIKNGALKVENKAGQTVLSGDNNGNLSLTGTLVNKSSSGVDAIKIQSTNIHFYDWERSARELGLIYSSQLTNYPNCRGFSMGHHNQGYMNLTYRKTDGTYLPYITFDKYNINPSYVAPIRFLEGTVFSQAVNMQNRVFTPSQIIFDKQLSSTSPKIFKNTGDSRNILTVQVSVNAVNDGFMIQSNTGSVLFGIHAGYNYPVYSNTSMQVNGNFTVTGSKNSLQATEHYGERLINAYETAEYYFGDIGSGVINSDGECVVHIDEILQECINTDCEYHVFTQVYNGSISRIERFNNYFIVHGQCGTEFSWELKAKRIGYENVRLDVPDIGTVEDIPVFTEEDLEVKTVEDTLLDVLTFRLEDILMEE